MDGCYTQNVCPLLVLLLLVLLLLLLLPGRSPHLPLPPLCLPHPAYRLLLLPAPLRAPSQLGASLAQPRCQQPLAPALHLPPFPLPHLLLLPHLHLLLPPLLHLLLLLLLPHPAFHLCGCPAGQRS